MRDPAVLPELRMGVVWDRCVTARRFIPVLTLAWVLIFAGGCAVRPGKHYGHLIFKPAPFFQVQVLDLRTAAGAALPVRDLLLLPPIGEAPVDVVREFPLLLWQELQQVLAGAVRLPRPSGAHLQYADIENLVADDGRVNLDELRQVGALAGASHVLLPMIVDCRPYPPQKITMELLLLAVADGKIAMVIVGALDASEQRVLIAADAYLRHRKAMPYDNDNLNVLLRSPRAFTGFALYEAVSALQDRVVAVHPTRGFKTSVIMAEIGIRE